MALKYKDKYFNQQLHRQSSSGSSGIPINVYWDKKDWYISNMSMWRKRQRCNGMLSEIIGEINNKLGDPIQEYKFIYYKSSNTLYCNIVLSSQFKKWTTTIKKHLDFLLKCKFKDNNIGFKVEAVQPICNHGKKHNVLEIV